MDSRLYWNRAEIKEKAKLDYKRDIPKSVVAGILLAIATGKMASFGKGFQNRFEVSEFGLETFAAIAGVALIAGSAVLFSILIKVFVLNVLEVGAQSYFMSSSRGKDDLGLIPEYFRKSYGNIVTAMFFRSLIIFGGFIAFIVPGIILSYSYRFVPYILSENPEMNYREALERSMYITKGHKADLFVMDLSFWGWYIIGAMALGVGVIFVYPYEYLSRAELYHQLKHTL